MYTFVFFQFDKKEENNFQVKKNFAALKARWQQRPPTFPPPSRPPVLSSAITQIVCLVSMRGETHAQDIRSLSSQFVNNSPIE